MATTGNAEEPEEPLSAQVDGTSRPKPKGRRASFENVRRDLSPEELASPGVQKLLLDELDRLDSELSEAKELGVKYYEEAKKVAVYEEKFRKHTALEIVSTGAVAFGSIILGLAYGAWSSQPFGWFFLITGVALLLAGLIAKAVKL